MVKKTQYILCIFFKAIVHNMISEVIIPSPLLYLEYFLDSSHQLRSHSIPWHHRDLEGSISAGRRGLWATQSSRHAQLSRGQLLPPGAAQALRTGQKTQLQQEQYGIP